MKKYVAIIGILLLVIVVTLTSDTMALYTKSFDFSLTLTVVPDPDRPIRPGDFLSYEYSADKTCAYAGDSGPACAQGSVVFNEGQFLKDNTVTVSQDGGAIRNYPMDSKQKLYLVSSRVKDITDAKWHNFGIYFNGSYMDTKEVISNGYVLKFLDNGDLVINEEGFWNNHNYPDHSGDSIHQTSQEPLRNKAVASADTIRQRLGIDSGNTGPINASEIDMQIRIKVNDASKVVAYVYINDVLVHDDGIILLNDKRNMHPGGDGKNNMIGLSTYGAGTRVTFTKLYMDNWDGDTTSTIPVED